MQHPSIGAILLAICVAAFAQMPANIYSCDKTSEGPNGCLAVVNQLRPNAEAGVPEAQAELGQAYFLGRGVAEDHAEAVRWFRKAAEQGNTDGQLLLGTMYMFGRGVAKDSAEGMRWIYKAAEQGNAGAQALMGMMYDAVPDYAETAVPDHAEAVRWYRKAAEQGHAYAQYKLGFMYENGRGVAADARAAFYLYQLAADGGVPDAKEVLDRLRSKGITSGVAPAGFVLKGTATAAAGTSGTSPGISVPAAPAYNPDEYARRMTAPTRPVIAYPDVQRPRLRRAADPHAYAVVIGAERYRRPIPNVPFALRDAATFQAYLVTTLGVPERNIKSVPDPALSDMIDALAWLADQARADRSGKVTLYVYYAGHGVPDEQSKTPYLLPVDARPERIRLTGYSLKTLTDTLAALPARSAIFLDACFSGAASRASSGQGLMAGKRPAYIDLKMPAAANVVLFSASQSNQTSNAMPETQHGLFTYFLLSGLNGKAADAQGHISLAGLFKYVRDEVSAAATRNGQSQTPTLTGPADLVLH